MQVPTDLIREIAGYSQTEYEPLAITDDAPFNRTNECYAWTFDSSIESDFIIETKTRITATGETKVLGKQKLLKSRFTKYIRHVLKEQIESDEAFRMEVGKFEEYWCLNENDDDDSKEEELNKCMEFIEAVYGAIFKL
jgi:hypothetical protein